MFGLFKKKDKAIPVTDKIWMNEHGKWQACFELYQQNPKTVFISWFEESRSHLRQYFESKAVSDMHIVDANFTNAFQQNDPIIFIEHFPLFAEEQQKFMDLRLEEAVIYSSLDEAIFDIFRGEKIVEVMRKMGMKEDEMIQNSMITMSVKRAQEKIASKAIISGTAQSQRDWLQNAGLVKDKN
jgi:hypothetical protein